MAGCFDFVQFFTGDKCTKYYKLGKTIGKGSYGAVKDSMDRRTHTFWAVKCINKQHLSHQDEDQVKTELKVLQMVNHENIVQFREAFNCHTTHYLVFERLDGGELFNRIVERTTHTELDAREIVRPLVNALAYLHSLNIVHGDIKPENLLFTTKDDKAPLKIIDFGSARVLSEGEVSVKPTTAGTHVYSSPELREGSLYNQSADIWSLGIITYIVLCGFHPFPKKRDIIHEVGFPSPYWDTVSKPAKALIEKMLQVDPEKRCTAKDMLQDPWINAVDLPSEPLPHFKASLKRYNAYQAVKNVVKNGISLSSLSRRSSSLSARSYVSNSSSSYSYRS